MIDRDEYRGLAFAGNRRGQVVPHIVLTVSGMMVPS
jgi:hypothetical protein